MVSTSMVYGCIIDVFNSEDISAECAGRQHRFGACKYILQAQFSNMFWGLMQIWWLGKAEPLYGEAGAKAPASLSFPLD